MKKKYTVEEILNDPEFVRWMKSEPSEGNFWETYGADNPENFTRLQQAIDRYNSLYHKPDNLDENRIATQKNRLINDILTQSRLRTLRQSGIVLGVLALIIVAGWYLIPQFTGYSVHNQNTTPITDNIHPDKATTIINTESQTLPVELPDESFVFLEPESSVTYDGQDFIQKRSVQLTGSAFFMVEKNPVSPFVVHSDHFQTTVLGTEFYVSDKVDYQESYVQVTDGRVEVVNKQDKDQKENPVVINRMESVHLDKKKNKMELIKDESQLPDNNAAITQSLTYRDVPVKDIFGDLSHKYKIKIVFDPQILKNCTLTASFKNMELDQAIYTICKMLDASYLKSDGQIEIFSKGC